MNIFKKLPYDLQEYVYNIYYEQNLIKRIPIIIIKHYQCKNNIIIADFEDNHFYIKSTLQCDDNHMCWVKCELYYFAYIGNSYNIYNIPIGYINNIDSIIINWKKVISEYIKYIYDYGIQTFKNCKKTYFEIRYLKDFFLEDRITNLNKLKHKLLKQIIKHQWFNEKLMIKSHKYKDILELIEIDEYAYPYMSERYLGYFRIDDTDPDIFSKYIRVPYSSDDCRYIKIKLPIIYKLLEKYNMLKSPYIQSSNMRKLIRLFIMDKTTINKNKYNEELEKTIQCFDKTYKNIIIPDTGYAYLPDNINELLLYEDLKNL
jgi:hypothetical protein